MKPSKCLNKIGILDVYVVIIHKWSFHGEFRSLDDPTHIRPYINMLCNAHYEL